MLRQIMGIDMYHDYTCDTCAVLKNEDFSEQIIIINFRTEKSYFYDYDGFVEYLNDEEFDEIDIRFYDDKNTWKNVIENIVLCNDWEISDALKKALA